MRTTVAPRRKRVEVRLTLEEFERLRAAVAADGRLLSDWVREALIAHSEGVMDSFCTDVIPVPVQKGQDNCRTESASDVSVRKLCDRCARVGRAVCAECKGGE